MLLVIFFFFCFCVFFFFNDTATTEIYTLSLHDALPISVIVEECIDNYVSAITHTFVGYIGGSSRFSRTDFYANAASVHIPEMFQHFNDRMASAFISTIQNSNLLKGRLRSPSKIKRLRSLALIVDEKVSESFEDQKVLSLLVDESKEEEFFKNIKG